VPHFFFLTTHCLPHLVNEGQQVSCNQSTINDQVRSQEWQRPPRWETIRQQAPCKSTPTSGGTDCTQSNTVGKSGGKPPGKLGQWPVMTILYLQPQQHKRQQSATTAQPKFYSPASTMQWHRMPAGVCWKMLSWGLVCY
jgi:hypothetical protein